MTKFERSIKEASRILDCKDDKTRRYYREGKLPVVKVGGEWPIDIEALKRKKPFLPGLGGD